MDFSSLFLSNALESLIQPIAREIGYFYNYESNIRSLENESQKLENIRSWVMQRAEAARRNLQVISPNVEAWLTSVNTTTADVAALMQRRRIEVERGCFNGWCPNFKSLYLLSRRAKRIALEVIELRNEGNNYDVFCYPVAPAVEIETIPSNSIEEFDFRKLKEEEVSCPNLEELSLWMTNISTLCSHQLPNGYFSKLRTLKVIDCKKLRNLMSPSVARGVVNLQRLWISGCPLMEEVITEEMSNNDEPLFPLLEKLELHRLPKLGHFFKTKRALEFPFLRQVYVDRCPEFKTFVQQGSVSTPSLKSVKVVNLNKWFNSKEEDGRS